MGHKESKKSKIKILSRQIFSPTGFAGIWTRHLLLPSPTRYHYATGVEGRLAKVWLWYLTFRIFLTLNQIWFKFWRFFWHQGNSKMILKMDIIQLLLEQDMSSISLSHFQLDMTFNISNTFCIKIFPRHYIWSIKFRSLVYGYM